VGQRSTIPSGKWLETGIVHQTRNSRGMPEIKFSNDKADRWIGRIEKREEKLSPTDLELFYQVRAIRDRDEKLDSHWAKVLFDLGKNL